MDREEIKTFINIWASAIALLCYCFSIVGSVPKGMLRLISLLHVLYLLTVLPLSLSSFQLITPTAFLLVWLCNFMLLLFSFEAGPLSGSPSCLHFVLAAALPIKIKQDSPPLEPSSEARSIHPTWKHIQTTKEQSGKVKQARSLNPTLAHIFTEKLGSSLNIHGMTALPAKVLLLALFHCATDYRSYLHPYLVWLLYGISLFFGTELVLAIYAVPGRVILSGLGLELEPQFNEPILTTSLEDFWGRRWNLTVSSILRLTVYNPLRKISVHILGHDLGSYAGVIATFAVSGLMHEVVFYYFQRVAPTWEVTVFFLVQGCCVVIEKAVKKRYRDTWQPNRVVSWVLTFGILGVTGLQLLGFPMMRNGIDEKAIRGCHVMVNYMKERVRLIVALSTNLFHKCFIFCKELQYKSYVQKPKRRKSKL